MSQSSPHEVTQLLQAWSDGNAEALDQLVPLVYGELHRLARHYMGGERPGQRQPDVPQPDDPDRGGPVPDLLAQRVVGGAGCGLNGHVLVYQQAGADGGEFFALGTVQLRVT